MEEYIAFRAIAYLPAAGKSNGQWLTYYLRELSVATITAYAYKQGF